MKKGFKRVMGLAAVVYTITLGAALAGPGDSDDPRWPGFMDWVRIGAEQRILEHAKYKEQYPKNPYVLGNPKEITQQLPLLLEKVRTVIQGKGSEYANRVLTAYSLLVREQHEGAGRSAPWHSLIECMDTLMIKPHYILEIKISHTKSLQYYDIYLSS